MLVLVADDEGPKLNNIHDVVVGALPSASIRTARSVRSALDALRNCAVNVLVLDMSLPTFDIAPGEQGGRPQNYGGIELLRYMDFYEIVCPVFIVTQYEAFPDKNGHVDLSDLAIRLGHEHPRTFVELIYYAGATDEGWRLKLVEALKNVEVTDL